MNTSKQIRQCGNSFGSAGQADAARLLEKLAGEVVVLECIYNNARYLINTATEGEFDKFMGFLPFEVSQDSFRDLEDAVREYEELDTEPLD